MKLLRIALVVVLIVFTLFVIYYYPVIDRVLYPCKHYPDTFADCREKGRKE